MTETVPPDTLGIMITPRLPLPLDPGRLVVLVVGGTEQSGKTTVAGRAAALLGVGTITSSAVLNAPTEARLGLAPGSIVSARVVDHNAYRADLVATGDEMRARGSSPGAECIANGFRVIDGLRTAKEVTMTKRAATDRGLTPVIIFVENPRKPVASDNTQTDALRAAADVIIRNDSSLDVLLRRADAAMRSLID